MTVREHAFILEVDIGLLVIAMGIVLLLCLIVKDEFCNIKLAALLPFAFCVEESIKFLLIHYILAALIFWPDQLRLSTEIVTEGLTCGVSRRYGARTILCAHWTSRSYTVKALLQCHLMLARYGLLKAELNILVYTSSFGISIIT